MSGAVTQADRDAVYAWQNASSHAPNKLAEAFARHRQQAEASFKAREDALVEALVGVRAWAASLTVCDMNEIVADNGITAGMVVGQEAGEQVRRIDRILAAHTATDAGGE